MTAAARDRPKGSMASVLGLARPYGSQVGALTLVSFIGALLEALFLVLVTAAAMALVTDRGPTVPLVAGVSLGMGSTLAVAGAVLTARLLLSLVGVRISANLTASVTADQRRELSHAFLGATWEAQHGTQSGNLQSLLTTFVQSATFSITMLTNGIVALLSLIAFLMTGLVVDAVATGAVLVALAVVAVILTPIKRLIQNSSRSLQHANLDFAQTVSELGSLGMEMQTFGVQDQFVTQIDRQSGAQTQVLRRVQALTGALAPVYMVLAYAAVLAGIAVLANFSSGPLDAISAVMLLMLRSLAYGQQVATAAGSMAAQAPAIERLNEAIRFYRESPASGGGRLPVDVAPVTLDEVSFGYTPHRPALSDLSFRIELGEVIGVVGPSGAGKSTLAQLLLGLREPAGGSLLVDNVPLNDVNRADWSRRVAFVSQDARLITGTVAENIRFFRSWIDDDALRVAAGRANILEEIEALPGGFDAHLGERGSGLSGGQRQRLSIARALAGNPDLLILDEPTSALDGRSEDLIREALGQLRGKVTVVLIAHRMSTLAICDRILVIERGRLSGIGTSAEVARTNEFYRQAMAIAGIDLQDD